MLLLCRMFMRLDQVLIRIRDTRIYVDFNTGTVIRDYTEKEAEFEKVKKVRTDAVSSPLSITFFDHSLLDYLYQANHAVTFVERSLGSHFLCKTGRPRDSC
jgi:hypothetical protein